MRSSFLTGTLGLAALCATLLSGASTGLAATANGPICDPNAKVNSTTYYGCGGGSHTGPSSLITTPATIFWERPVDSSTT